jgi:hypothetical protein
MTIFQALLLGILVAWTPSLVVLAFLLWRRTPIGKTDELSANALCAQFGHLDRSELPRSTKDGVPILCGEGTTLQPQAEKQDKEDAPRGKSRSLSITTECCDNRLASQALSIRPIVSRFHPAPEAIDQSALRPDKGLLRTQQA